MVKIAIIYHSGYGHTKRLATAVLDGCLSVKNTEAKMIDVENMSQDWDYINECDALIFGSPTYMGSISAPFKKFMDDTSKIWLKQGWNQKIAAGFVNSGWPSGDKLNTMIQLSLFAAQHGMIWINPGIIPGNLSSNPDEKELNRLGSFLGVMSMSPFDEKCDTAPPDCDMKTASILGKRVAESALIWNEGKDVLAKKTQKVSKEKGETHMKKYRCTVCNYIYDPAVGDPDNGVDPGTPFENLPDEWVCPLCGVDKDQFEVEE